MPLVFESLDCCICAQLKTHNLQVNKIYITTNYHIAYYIINNRWIALNTCVHNPTLYIIQLLIWACTYVCVCIMRSIESHHHNHHLDTTQLNSKGIVCVCNRSNYKQGQHNEKTNERTNYTTRIITNSRDQLYTKQVIHIESFAFHFKLLWFACPNLWLTGYSANHKWAIK